MKMSNKYYLDNYLNQNDLTAKLYYVNGTNIEPTPVKGILTSRYDFSVAHSWNDGTNSISSMLTGLANSAISFLGNLETTYNSIANILGNSGRSIIDNTSLKNTEAGSILKRFLPNQLSNSMLTQVVLKDPSSLYKKFGGTSINLSPPSMEIYYINDSDDPNSSVLTKVKNLFGETGKFDLLNMPETTKYVEMWKDAYSKSQEAIKAVKEFNEVSKRVNKTPEGSDEDENSTYADDYAMAASEAEITSAEASDAVKKALNAKIPPITKELEQISSTNLKFGGNYYNFNGMAAINTPPSGFRYTADFSENYDIDGTFRLVTNRFVLNNLVLSNMRVEFCDSVSCINKEPLYAKVSLDFEFAKLPTQLDIIKMLTEKPVIETASTTKNKTTASTTKTTSTNTTANKTTTK